MPFIEKFLGRGVNIPEDRRYYAKQGLWAKPEEDEVAFGLTEPFLVLAGGLTELDWLCEDGQVVEQNEAVVFAITGKIQYIEAPIEGIVFFNSPLKKDPAAVDQDPYGSREWLFKIKSQADIHQVLTASLDAHQYLESLKGSEGFKNPEGLKGGVSGICKAVYSGIREQKLS